MRGKWWHSLCVRVEREVHRIVEQRGPVVRSVGRSVGWSELEDQEGGFCSNSSNSISSISSSNPHKRGMKKRKVEAAQEGEEEKIRPVPTKNGARPLCDFLPSFCFSSSLNATNSLLMVFRFTTTASAAQVVRWWFFGGVGGGPVFPPTWMGRGGSRRAAEGLFVLFIYFCPRFIRFFTAAAIRGALLQHPAAPSGSLVCPCVLCHCDLFWMCAFSPLPTVAIFIEIYL